MMQENKTSRKQLKCNYCNQFDYLVDCCYYLHGFLVGHKLHGKNVKLKKLDVHNIHTNIVEPIKGPTIGVVAFTTKEYDQLMALLEKRMVIINFSQILQV